MRRLLILAVCLAAGLSAQGCGSGSPAKILKVSVRPVFYTESYASERHKKYFMDQKLAVGVAKLKKSMEAGEPIAKEPPKTLNQAVDQFLGTVMWSDEEFAKLQKMIDETNFILAGQICENIGTNLSKMDNRIMIVKDKADVDIDVTIKKTTRGTDFSMIIADLTAYKGSSGGIEKFSGQFDAYETISIETPEQLGKILAKMILKDFKKTGL